MENFRRIVADNIIRLRTQAQMTQSELGEKLSYSDKSISKWERAESLPDAYVLKQISDMFGVSVDYLLSEHSEDEEIPETKDSPQEEHGYSRTVITLIALFGILAVAVLAFVVIWIVGYVMWQMFIYVIPLVLVVLLVLNSIWGRPRNNVYIISGIVWGIIACLYMIFLEHNWWQLFIIGIPAQIIVVLCFYVKKSRNQ